MSKPFDAWVQTFELAGAERDGMFYVVSIESGLKAVIEKHVQGLLYMAVLEGKKINKGDGLKEAFEHARQHACSVVEDLCDDRKIAEGR